MRHRFLGIALLFCCAFAPLSAQWWKVTQPEDVWLLQMGLGVNLGMAQHSGAFTLPQAPTCCTSYDGATSFGPALSLFIRQEITKHVRLTLRGTYTLYDGSFTTTENIFVTNAVEGTVEHSLDASMGWIGGELLADIRVINPLRLMVGGSLGTYAQPTFSQKESLLNPTLGTFENGRRVRNETQNATIENITSPALGLVFGVGVDIPVTSNHSVVITPEILYTVGLTDIVQGEAWRANLLRVGATVALSLNAPAPPPDVERRREVFVDSLIVDVAPDAERRRVLGAERVATDTVEGRDVVVITDRVYRTDTVYTPIPPDLKAAIAVRAIDAAGAQKNVFAINVSTQFVTEALPLLPVVFFEAQALSLSFRYRQVSKPEEFDITSIPPRTTAVHREILNIVGERMQKLPSTTIRLRGTSDPTTEGADCELARKRADAVRSYLTRVWSIAPDRIAIESGSGSCAPERVTRQQSEDGYSENRRVEILTSDLQLLASVAKSRFNEARTVDPPQLVFDPSGSSTRYVTDWSMEAVSGSTVVYSKSGQGVATIVNQPMTTAGADMLVDGKQLEVRLRINGLHGSTAVATAAIPVRKDTMKIELERLTLTLFDVASDAITPIAEEQIKTFVENVPAGSMVVVRGFADMLGNAEFNRKLSQKRADAVCATIRKHIKKRVELQCNEIRTDRFPPGIESYATPEERFLSRTVQIEVKKSR
mgnify:CR=1 FL=1